MRIVCRRKRTFTHFQPILSHNYHRRKNALPFKLPLQFSIQSADDLSLEEHSEALVKPEMFPVAIGHQVACPGMGDLKCNFRINKGLRFLTSWAMTLTRLRSPASRVGVTNVRHGFSIHKNSTLFIENYRIWNRIVRKSKSQKFRFKIKIFVEIRIETQNTLDQRIYCYKMQKGIKFYLQMGMSEAKPWDHICPIRIFL